MQAELERIREERAAAQAKKLAEEKALLDKQMRDEALKSNPLAAMVDEDSTAKVSLISPRTIFALPFCSTLTQPPNAVCRFQIKRRWNDDVIFRNQARDEPERKKRFINDTVRSDFHRNFLKKYVK